MVAMGTALAFTLAGCTTSPEEWLHPQPAVSAEQNSLYSPETIRHLFGSNAPLHIIDVPITNAKPAKGLSSSDDKEGEKFIKDLHSSKGTFRTSVGKAFAKATLGRYQPATVNYTQTTPYDLAGGCMDIWTPNALDKLNKFIRDSAKPDQLNIAVVEAYTCKPPEGMQGARGFAFPGTVPIVAKGDLKDAAGTAVHEGGHYVNPHAGIAECSDVTHIQGCTVNETADYWSPMGYNGGDEFTPRELLNMNLLRQDEVVDLRNVSGSSQEVTLTDMSHKKGVKLVIGKTAAGNALYFSWTKDIQAGWRDKCEQVKHEYDTPKGAKEEDTLWGFNDTDPKTKKTKYYWCYDIDKTKQNHTLQMRVEAPGVNEGTDAAYKGESLVWVVPPGEKVKGTQDQYINQDKSFMNPYQVVYAGGKDALPIAYVSANNNKAVVRIG